MSSQIKMSHSIHMLSIQIDTKSLYIGYSPSGQQHQIDRLCEFFIMYV